MLGDEWSAAQRMGQTGLDGVRGKEQLSEDVKKDIKAYADNIVVLQNWYTKGGHLKDDWFASKHLVAI